MRKRIIEELNTTYSAIRDALFGITQTDKTLEIRKRALDLGGVEINS